MIKHIKLDLTKRYTINGKTIDFTKFIDPKSIYYYNMPVEGLIRELQLGTSFSNSFNNIFNINNILHYLEIPDSKVNSKSEDVSKVNSFIYEYFKITKITGLDINEIIPDVMNTLCSWYMDPYELFDSTLNINRHLKSKFYISAHLIGLQRHDLFCVKNFEEFGSMSFKIKAEVSDQIECDLGLIESSEDSGKETKIEKFNLNDF